jgi:hypothetical protein
LSANGQKSCQSLPQPVLGSLGHNPAAQCSLRRADLQSVG